MTQKKKKSERGRKGEKKHKNRIESDTIEKKNMNIIMTICILTKIQVSPLRKRPLGWSKIWGTKNSYQ